MPPELTALIAKPHLLVSVLAIGIVCGMAVEQFLSRMRRRTWRDRNRGRNGARPLRTAATPWQAGGSKAPRLLDAADQLRYVMEAPFTIQPLLNRSEARLFKELDRMVIACNQSWQVMAQVSLGEILRSTDADAHSCINSKRVDLLLVDGDCTPRHAVEYQGGAHHQGSAAARDAIKKEALRRAGIGYHEVVAGQTTPAELKRLVEKLVDKPASG